MAASMLSSWGSLSLRSPAPHSLGWAPSSVPLNRVADPSSLRSTKGRSSVITAEETSSSTSKARFSRRHGLLYAAVLLAPATLVGSPFLQEDQFLANAAEEKVLEVIRTEIKTVLKPFAAPSLLRLVFHDAGTFNIESNTGGMNGSILQELERRENYGLKKPVQILERAKENIDQISPVSWADLIAVAGAEAVAICGGPVIPVKLGRLDSLDPDPEGELPGETLPADELKQLFQKKGFLVRELVALSGAHTIGSKGFGAPTVFDNAYFKVLTSKPAAGSMVGLPTDRAISNDEECFQWITAYAEDQELFFKDFSAAYLKMVDSGARWQA
eukprot:TRINITY_DN15764_c0_g1_i1.p1 TRINITY_DN15764_c0_g1~~TRINITY_DN15764_c0_g1_i1.p1  ORF type:complete len:329 (-),score=65.92 TRINITY_DN15764_c0_g1_i1:216-1202(-)